MRITVAGDISAPEFHQCCSYTNEAALVLQTDVDIKALLEIDWEAYVVRKQQQDGGQYYKHTARYVVLVDGAYTGVQSDLQALLQARFPQHTIERIPQDWQAAARHALKAAVRNPLVYMDVDVGGKPQRVVFELYSDVCPRACENFRRLCTSRRAGQTYLGTPFHRVVPGGWVQGGDVAGGAGDRGSCALDNCASGTFEDETFDVKFDAAGVLAMANAGPHTNASQFLVALAQLPWLDRRAVAFGRVARGMRALRALEDVATLNQRPLRDARVVACGELAPEDL
ncbi:radial spoke protein 12 [Tribonema minus]|uniref:Peptidyl-prolyl cis-trans isomerase n=1 Tax=Tribonema minus TaxID=303371 RepID=A0A836C6W1_9STRA|nr:radial spoke protein 12 [Tribonema minus]